MPVANRLSFEKVYTVVNQWISHWKYIQQKKIQDYQQRYKPINLSKKKLLNLIQYDDPFKCLCSDGNYLFLENYFLEREYFSKWTCMQFRIVYFGMHGLQCTNIKCVWIHITTKIEWCCMKNEGLSPNDQWLFLDTTYLYQYFILR